MNSTDVIFESDGCPLAGTFVEADSPVAAALLITGSGKTDRNSDIRLPFGQILRARITSAMAATLDLARVSSLRFDKRGVGASGGDYFSAGMDQRLADSAAALAWLAARQPGLPLLVIGHSEGTYHAARLAGGDGGAAGRPPVAGAVLVSGSVHTGDELLPWQAEQLAPRLRGAERLLLKLMRTDAVSAQRKNQAKLMASRSDAVWLHGTKVPARWFRDFIRYDPAPPLARIGVPVLAITGGHDLQVPPADVEAMGKLVTGEFEGHIVGDLSHLLRPDPGCLGPRSYYRRVNEEVVSPEVLNLINDWVGRHWVGAGR